MNPDNRNRLPGSSKDKKRKFGRKKKRPRVFYTRRETASGSTTTDRSSTSNPSRQIILDPPSLSRSTTRTRPDTSTPNTESVNIQPGVASGSGIVTNSNVPLSRSHQKLKITPMEAGNVQNRIIDVSILYPALQEALVCNKCHGRVKLSEVDVRGLGFKLCVTCSGCHKVDFIDSCRKVGKKKNAYENNRRSLLGMRALGHGHTGLQNFCGIMDLQNPVSHSNFDIMNEDLKLASEKVAKKSMQAAMKEDYSPENPRTSEITVSGDGSWRKRGHSSLQGVTTLILEENGKVVDLSAKQSFCRACENHPEEDTEEYREWFESHRENCSANHSGSSGKMEVNGIVEMFRRSESFHGVKYSNYIGDGDSSVFKSLCDDKPYGQEFVIKKKECVQHVQKRMGTRLRNIKKAYSGKKLSDKKGIGGRGRLTAQVIDQLTRYYGNAIRGHKDSVEEMSNAIWATYYHKLSTDQNPQHHLCPEGTRSWCKWQKAKANGTLKNFHHSSNIPVAIMEVIKPIYQDLTNTELLEKCLGGFTQNSNESFNQSIWKLIPKSSFSGLKVLEIGAYIAAVCFNEGRTGFLEVMKEFGVQPGSSAVDWARRTDENRLFWAEKKTAGATLEARQSRRKRNLQDEDSYSAGAY